MNWGHLLHRAVHLLTETEGGKEATKKVGEVTTGALSDLTDGVIGTFNPKQRMLNACKSGELSKVKELVSNGVSVNFYFFNLSPVEVAIRNNRLSIVEYLTSKGANTKDLLVTAVKAPRPSYTIVKLVLDHGAYIDEKDSWTALMHALSGSCDSAICTLLIDKGASVNVSNCSSTPLECAIRGISSKRIGIDVCELLLKKGANINGKNSYGGTALHTAAELGSEEAIRFLLSYKADRSIRDNHGRTPLDKAREWCSNKPNCETIASLLAPCL